MKFNLVGQIERVLGGFFFFTGGGFNLSSLFLRELASPSAK
jgi:hypothetical protein